jgi:hypothetical protein
MHRGEGGVDRTAIGWGCLTILFQYVLRSNGWNSRLEVELPVLRYKRELISPRKRLITIFLFIFTQTFSWKYPSQHLPIMSESVTSSHNEHFNSLWECLDLTECQPNGNNQRADRPSQAMVLIEDDEIASSSQGLEGDAGNAGGVGDAKRDAEGDTVSLQEGQQ